ncbi:MAG: PEGA domain-containing protein [Paludibacteraceae bacterium]|nr:PEGA domain-containing protein [Paludibacteraceae bacterium]
MRNTHIYIIYALLLVCSVTVNAQQWVTFTVHPNKAILTVDSERHILFNGSLELLLPLGNHFYSAESPGFESFADTFNLCDDARRDIIVVLQSDYGYLSLLSSGTKDKIYIDQQEIGTHRVQSVRYKAGTHRLTVFRGEDCLCDQAVIVTAGTKKVFNIDSLNVTPFVWDPARWLIPVTAIGADGQVTDSMSLAEVRAAIELDSAAINVTSNVDGAEILIDDRVVGTTPLVITKLIANRKYLITLRKPGFRSVSRTIHVAPDGVTEAYIKMKKH